MKVVLLQKVAGLGQVDDIKEVSEGYARNFLFPKNLAVLASPKMIKEAENHKHKKTKNDEKDLRETQKLADRLNGLHLVIEEKANEAGFLYAAVGAQKVCVILRERGIEIRKDNVVSEPIKNIGDYVVKIKLKHNLEAQINLSIISKKD